MRGVGYTPPRRPVRKADAGTALPGQLMGRRRWDASRAGYVIVAAAVLLVGLFAVAAYLYVHVGVDLAVVARDLVAPGSVGALILGAVGWVLREKLVPQQAGTQREVGAIRTEMVAFRSELTALREHSDQRDADLEQVSTTLAQISGVVSQAVGRIGGFQEALLLMRHDVSGATEAAQDATRAALEAAGAVMDLQRMLVSAAQAGRAADEEAAQAERARRAARREAQLAAERAAEDAAAQAAEEAAAGTRWLTGPQDVVQAAVVPASPAGELEPLTQLEAAPVTPVRALPVVAEAHGATRYEPARSAQPEPVDPADPVEQAEPPRRITPLDPEWVAPATGMLPAVPPKDDPDLDTGVHHWITTGRWPEGYDPDNPPPRNR